jgi:uroporphyrinogen-III decarboxylase
VIVPGADAINENDISSALMPQERMSDAARRLRDVYACRPGAPLYHAEDLGYFSLDAWREEGMPVDIPRNELFNLDTGGYHLLLARMIDPPFEEKILEDRGDYELVQDAAGRHVLFFKGRRNGFMPQYLDHPVKDRKTWEEDLAWRLDPDSQTRYRDLPNLIATAKAAVAQGAILRVRTGGYAFIRNMIGTLKILYAFYDMPDVIHEMMQAWVRVTDDTLARYQEHLTIDELFLGEDICYKTGSFISEDMFREFLLPYFQQIVHNVRERQLDRERPFYVHIDSDGHVEEAIPLYQEMGMNVMSPFEVAADNDVIEIARRYPELVMWGGIDKRVLATSPEEIDEMLYRLLPVMRDRGGFIPICDHGVPPEVPYENYLHYRRRCVELGGW